MSSTETDMEQHPLLGNGDPDPYALLDGSGSNHALLAGDHAGRAIPKVLGTLGLNADDLNRHIAYDIGSRELIELLSEFLGLPALMGNYSRLVVDLNRRLDDPTAFPGQSDATAIPGNSKLSAAARESRVREIYQPYHAAIDRWLNDAQGRGLVPALIAVHSFTPELNGTRRPWQVGILSDQDRRIAAPLIQGLRGHGSILVGDNEPYSGKHIADYTIDHHAEAAGLPCVSIEVRQDLLATAPDRAYWAGILARELELILADPALQSHMTDPLPVPAGYANP